MVPIGPILVQLVKLVSNMLLEIKQVTLSRQFEVHINVVYVYIVVVWLLIRYRENKFAENLNRI